MKTPFGLKKEITLIALALSGLTYSQVGINNTTPQATLDVTAKTTDGTKPEGIIAPRLTGDQIKSANSQYTTAQQGAIVYATSAISSADSTGKSSNITTAGYFYFDGSVWQSIGNRMTANNGLTKSGNNIQLGGALTQPTTISGVTNTNNLAVTATGVNAINLASNTLSVDATNNRVGIGTTTPTGALEIVSTNSGFVPPRMTLAQANAMAKVQGTIAYIIDFNGLNEWTGSSWRNLYNGNSMSIFFATAGIDSAELSGPTNYGYQPLVFTNPLFNSGSDISLDTTTGIFTLKPGTYVVNANVSALGSTYPAYIGYTLVYSDSNIPVYPNSHNDVFPVYLGSGSSSSASWTFVVPSAPLSGTRYRISSYYYLGSIRYRYNSSLSIQRIY